jgi:hypothetical protein
VSAAGADSFEFAVLLPAGDSLVTAGGLPFNAVELEELRQAAVAELGWHVVWIGVEP